MAFGLLPAAVAFIVLAVVLTAFGVTLPRVTDWLTPFADNWAGGLRVLLRVSLGVVLFGGASAVAILTFTALTLAIGDPFYARIHEAAEAECGPPAPTYGVSMWRAVAAGLRLVLLGLLVAVAVALIGLIPVVGAPLAAVLGIALTGNLLARELMGRSFDAHGLSDEARFAVTRTGRLRVLGFGVATQLCFLVPLGAIVTMPAAVTGATYLARDLAGRGRESRDDGHS